LQIRRHCRPGAEQDIEEWGDITEKKKKKKKFKGNFKILGGLLHKKHEI
jgi:hypothetical protein